MEQTFLQGRKPSEPAPTTETLFRYTPTTSLKLFFSYHLKLQRKKILIPNKT